MTLLIPLRWKTHQILSKKERGSVMKSIDLDRVTIAQISANCLRHK
jgi:DNA-directed RNA polymerase subunit H (RpoH/RPB5)